MNQEDIILSSFQHYIVYPCRNMTLQSINMSNLYAELERETGKWRGLQLTGSFSKCLPCFVLGQPKTRSLQLFPGLSHECHGPKHFPANFPGTLAGKWVGSWATRIRSGAHLVYCLAGNSLTCSSTLSVTKPVNFF